MSKRVVYDVGGGCLGMGFSQFQCLCPSLYLAGCSVSGERESREGKILSRVEMVDNTMTVTEFSFVVCESE